MAGTLLSWLRRTVIDLSEKAVEDSLDINENQPIDFEILGDPKHPKFPEMRRRYAVRQAREDHDDPE